MNFEIPQVVDPRHGKRVPRQVMNAAAVLIDKVMMAANVWVEDGAASAQGVPADESFSDKEAERLVNAGPRDTRKYLPGFRPHLACRRMFIRVKNVLRYRDSSGGRPDAARLQEPGDFRGFDREHFCAAEHW